MKKKSILYPIFFMFIVTAVFTFVLAVLNHTTADIIKENQDFELRKKILYVFDLLDEKDTQEDVNEKFEGRITERDYKDEQKIYILEDGDEKAYAVPFNGPGLWGSIHGYIGVDGDLKKITGIEFISQSETPGLGGRIAEKPYKEQFRDVDITERIGNELIINRPAPGGNVDAIAGATQTSTFVKNMLNKDLIDFIDKGGME
ncbi:MAG: FMN-binding protein [Tissierellia bacterium]|nr:FMN-binding protein [Tissierellia bacterium]